MLVLRQDSAVCEHPQVREALLRLKLLAVDAWTAVPKSTLTA